MDYICPRTQTLSFSSSAVYPPYNQQTSGWRHNLQSNQTYDVSIGCVDSFAPIAAPTNAPSTPPTTVPTFSPSIAPSSAPSIPPTSAPTLLCGGLFLSINSSVNDPHYSYFEGWYRRQDNLRNDHYCFNGPVIWHINVDA